MNENRRAGSVACGIILFALIGQRAWAQQALESGQAQTEPQATTAEQGHEMGTAGGLGPMTIRGFTDVNFRANRPSDKPNTFALGQLDLFLTSEPASDISVLSEIVLEAGDDNKTNVDVERALLRYSPSDLLSVSVGRFHSAIGFYNTAYHHGNWFQTASGRPFIFNFEDEGGLLPVHGVGVAAQGNIPSGGAGLQYVAELSNGRSSTVRGAEPVQNVEDENRRKAVNLGLLARPSSLPGSQMGVSAYFDRLEPEAKASVSEAIIAAHFVYQGQQFEWLSEAIFVRHTPENTSTTATTSSIYVQASKPIGRFRPYVRYEYVNVPADDPVFGGLGRSHGPSLGLRYDLATAAALKFEYRRFTGGLKDQMTATTIQLAFVF